MRRPVRAPPPRANKSVTRIASICLNVMMIMVMNMAKNMMFMMMARMFVLPAGLLGTTPSPLAPKHLEHHEVVKMMRIAMMAMLMLMAMMATLSSCHWLRVVLKCPAWGKISWREDFDMSLLNWSYLDAFFL